MEILNLIDEPEHLPQLAEWHHREWSWISPDTTVEQRVEKMLPHLEPGVIPSTFIAKIDGKLLGSASLVQNDMKSRPELSPWLAGVFVAPEYRRRGVGASLVRHVMVAAKEAGFDTLYLFTPDQQRFYKNLGWIVLWEEEYRGEHVTVMQAMN